MQTSDMRNERSRATLAVPESAPKINLIHVALDMGIGGLQRLITETTLAMDRKKFNVEVVCLDFLGCFADELSKHGIPVTLLNRHERHLIFYPSTLAKFLKVRNAHIVQMHPGTFIFGVLAAKLARVPATVYTEHGRAVVESKVRLYEDWVAGKLVDRVIAVSKDLELILAERVKIPSKKICTVINGIPVSGFQPGPKPAHLMEELGISSQDSVLGTVARLDEIKDQLTMLKAFKLVKERIGAVKLLIVGEGDCRERLTRYIVSNGLERDAIITGQRSDVPELLRLFDIFLLSSLSEGTSISLLEAMSAGAVPVVTAVGGNPAIVSHNVDGLLVKPRNPEEIAEAVCRLLQDLQTKEAFSKAATAKVREHFSIERMVKTYTDIYMEILGSKRKSRRLLEKL